jgi:hypothetical protein
MKKVGKTLSTVNNDVNPLRETATKQANVNLTFQCSEQ